MAQTGSRIGDIQILRAVAIIFVLMQHLSITATVMGSLPTKVPMPFWSGVELFFVISGLVVTQSVFSRRTAPLAFVGRRLFRLWPAMLFFIFFSSSVCALAYLLPTDAWGYDQYAAGSGDFMREALAIMAGLFINLDGATIYTNGAMWSLSVEFQFYFAYAIALSFIVFIQAGTGAARTTVLMISSVLYSAILLQRIGLFIGVPLLDTPILNYVREWRFDFMLLGVIIAFIPISKKAWGPSLTPLLIGVPLVIVMLSEDIFLPAPKPFLEGFALAVMGVLFAALCLLAKTDAAFHGKGTATYAVMDWIGDRSFSIYLLHFPVMALVWMLLFWFWPSAFNPPFGYGVIQAVLTLAITLPLADFSVRAIERPGQKVGKLVMGKLGARPAPAIP